MARIRKNDSVQVLSGKDKGKTGKVIEISLKKDKVIVEGVAIITKHVKARRQGETSGIKKSETYIDISKVMPICGSCHKPCRVSVKMLDDGKKSRVCSQCKEIF
jgi:large subunit ribosomal protein L24